MKKYLVAWTEHHEAVIWAKNEGEAVELSRDVPREISIKKEVGEPVIFLENEEEEEDEGPDGMHLAKMKMEDNL